MSNNEIEGDHGGMRKYRGNSPQTQEDISAYTEEQLLL
jgi:hypothetical protein